MMQAPTATAWVFGPFALSPDTRLLLRAGEPVPLTPKAFDTLVFLIEHRARVVTKDELLRALWPDVVVEEGNLTQQIFLLRKALDDPSDAQRYIATVPRVGYRFVASVTGPAASIWEPASSAVPNTRRGAAWRVAFAVGLLIILIAAIASGVLLWRRLGREPTLAYNFTQLTAEAGVESFPSLSPDGLWFVYASGPLEVMDESDIWLRRVGQDRPVNLTGGEPAAATQPAFSPDGEWVAFRSERLGGGIFRMRITGGPSQQVTNEGYNPAWSPDGRKIAYSMASAAASPYARRGRGELRIVDVTSGERVRLVTSNAWQPHWSPHGDRIAYWDNGIYTVSSSGGAAKPAAGANRASAAEVYWNPVWAPDGRHLYFSSNRGGTMGLWRVPIDERTGDPTGGPEAVVTPSTFAAHVTFSRAGDRFAFASLPSRESILRAEFDPQRGKIVGSPVAVTTDTRGWVYPEPSPDGRMLAFHSSIGTTQEDIYISESDGSNLRQLTNDPALDRVARWSPDGRRLAFYSDRGRRDGADIWIVNASGSELRQVTRAPAGLTVLFPVWSPDGKRMAASAFGRGTVIFDADRPWDPSKVRFLPAVDGKAARMQPWSWSADGIRIAGHGPLTGGIVVFSLETNTYQRLTTFGKQPVWLNDDRRLMFAFEDRLFVVDSRTRATAEVIAFQQGRIELTEGGGFGLTKDNRTIYVAPVRREGDIWLAERK